MRRLSLVLLPFLAAFAMVFGLYYVYTGIRLVERGATVAAGLVFLFGAMGVGLAVAIWVARKRMSGVSGSSQPSPRKPAT